MQAIALIESQSEKKCRVAIDDFSGIDVDTADCVTSNNRVFLFNTRFIRDAHSDRR